MVHSPLLCFWFRLIIDTDATRGNANKTKVEITIASHKSSPTKEEQKFVRRTKQQQQNNNLKMEPDV